MIDLWDAETYQYLRTITLEGDMTADLFVFPTPPTLTADSVSSVGRGQPFTAPQLERAVNDVCASAVD